VYRHLFNRDLYLMAYGKIYSNAGALTPGSTPETADDMSLRKIDAIIEAVRYERYRWTPARRVYIEKKHSMKKRPLSMPTWSDKLLQEVIRLILESYYEPQMSECSHGFRPGKGCHTALQDIDRTWLGTTWYLEGDIKACFDSLDHQILLDTLAENIHDGRFLRLIRELLQAGYLEDWKYNATLSGAPQGSLCKALHKDPYAKWKAMQSKCKKSLKTPALLSDCLCIVLCKPIGLITGHQIRDAFFLQKRYLLRGI
jgi:retron-type reverse transcriptase